MILFHFNPPYPSPGLSSAEAHDIQTNTYMAIYCYSDIAILLSLSDADKGTGCEAAYRREVPEYHKYFN